MNEERERKRNSILKGNTLIELTVSKTNEYIEERVTQVYSFPWIKISFASWILFYFFLHRNRFIINISTFRDKHIVICCIDLHVRIYFEFFSIKIYVPKILHKTYGICSNQTQYAKKLVFIFKRKNTKHNIIRFFLVPHI